MPPLNTSKFVERARNLQREVSEFASELSKASRAALAATNPELEGTRVGEEWPLIRGEAIDDRINVMSRLASMPEEPSDLRPFEKEEFRNWELVGVYGNEAPKHALALDLLSWSGKMERAGWPLFVKLRVSASSTLGEPNCIIIEIYEDSDATKELFGTLTGGSQSVQPHTYLSPRVIADDPQFSAEVLAMKRSLAVTYEDFRNHWGSGFGISWANILRKVRSNPDCPLQISDDDPHVLQGDIDEGVAWFRDYYKAKGQAEPCFVHILERIRNDEPMVEAPDEKSFLDG